MSFNDKNKKKELLDSTRKFTPSSRTGTVKVKSNDISDRDKKKASIKRKKKRRSIVYGIFRFIAAILKLIIILMIIGILCAAGLGVGLYLSIMNGAGQLSKEDLEINNFTTYIYDINGNEYTTLSGAENRTYASLDEINPYLPKAFISIEDERFYQHKGVDIKRTAGATFKYILSKLGMGSSDFGGSTITQQVIKKVTGEDDRSSLRKAKEIIRAFQLEKWLSKDEIIELYMNLIYLGEGSYGVEAASYTYFGKSAEDLDIAECAVIAGLAQAPEGYNPYKHPEKAKSRQELVLGKMYELEYITEAQYEEAKEKELTYTKGELNLASSNSYFVDAVVESVISDLMKAKGVNRQLAQKMVYNNGLRIYTTLDPEVQNILEETYLKQDYFHTRKGYDENLQSAMVIIDYKEGNVVGLVGGAGEKTTLRGLNRATGMTRSIGSNMKPLGVYGPGLELGILTAATTFDDVPTTYKIGGRAWNIKNYDGRYRGLMSIRKAIEISDNIVAAKAIQEKVGTEYSYQFLQKLGISTLTSADKQSPASLSLGGMNKGISPLEVAAAYGTIANKGVYVEPRLYTRIDDRNGQLFFTKTQEIRDVMSIENAYILTDMMHTVTTGSEGTGRAARIDGGIEVAAKTGTTSDDKDRWFSAFTPYYVGSVWFGYDTPTYINVATNPGTKVWHDVMNQVHKIKGCKSATFEKPAGVVEVAVCRDSGLLATDACKQDRRGSRVYTEIFNSKNGSIPKQKCNIHEFVTVCPDTFLLPTDECRKQSTLIEISRINRHYQNGQPTIKPWDYDNETPTTYCEFHKPQSEINFERVDNEVKQINEIVNQGGTVPITTPGTAATPWPEGMSNTSPSAQSAVTETTPTTKPPDKTSTPTSTPVSTGKSDTINPDTSNGFWWER
jgi:penicillin-binding protein 1A